MTLTVENVPEDQAYVAHAGDQVAGRAEYQLAKALVVFTHTEVEPRFEGQGVGGTLVREALDDVRSRGLSVLPLCPFVKAWIGRHPDYQDLVYRAAPSTVTD